jgi:hypothetical protein
VVCVVAACERAGLGAVRAFPPRPRPAPLDAF